MIELKITATDPVDLMRQLAAFFPVPTSPPMVVVPQGAPPVPTEEAKAEEPKTRTRKPLKIEPVAEEPEVPGTETAVETVAETPAEETKVEEPTQTESGALDYETDIKPAVLRLAMQKHRPAVMEVLDSIEKGCTSAKDLDKKLWPKLLAAIEAKLEA